jgi:hypothetical protein
MGLILIPILGLTIHNEKTLFRVVNTLVIAGLIHLACLTGDYLFFPDDATLLKKP